MRALLSQETFYTIWFLNYVIKQYNFENIHDWIHSILVKYHKKEYEIKKTTTRYPINIIPIKNINIH